MKKLYLLLCSFLVSIVVTAQNVGIGTAAPHASAMLEISSSNKGLLLPRVTDTSAISAPAKGLTIYSTNNNKLWYYDGNRWQQAMSHSGGMDSIWYKAQDSIVYTTKPFVGINTDLDLIAPQANLQVNGSILVQAKQRFSKASPTAGQVYTMNNTASFQNINNADSVFRIYDPGGTSNYNNNMQGNIRADATVSPQTGFKISSVAADFGIAAGDTLWISISGYPYCQNDYYYRFTNTLSNPADFIIPTNLICYFIFRSNSDGQNNKGFNFLVTRLYEPITASKQITESGTGFYFNHTTGSLASGFNARALGLKSTSLGMSNLASGDYSVAMGQVSLAQGDNSFASGYGAQARGSASAVTGYFSEADGDNSFASGYSSRAFAGNSVAMAGGTAYGQNGVAIGSNAYAHGDFTTAFGYGTQAYAYMGTVIGRNNYPVGNTTAWVNTDPLFTVGKGASAIDPANAFVVLKNGQTGININTPFTDLHIIQQADGGLDKTRGIRIQRSTGTNQWRTFIDPSNNYIFEYNNALYSYIEPVGGTFVAASDERLKKDIRPMESTLDKIMLLQPKTYHYKVNNDSDPRLYGFIAQDVEKLFPDLVFSSEDGRKGISYGNFSVIAVKAIQQQQELIIDLRKENEEIKKKQSLLEERLALLEKKQ